MEESSGSSESSLFNAVPDKEDVFKAHIMSYIDQNNKKLQQQINELKEQYAKLNSLLPACEPVSSKTLATTETTIVANVVPQARVQPSAGNLLSATEEDIFKAKIMFYMVQKHAQLQQQINELKVEHAKLSKRLLAS